MADLFYISGNQLFSPSLLAEHRNATVLMVESDDFCRRLPFHQQKIGLVLAAMREHRHLLTQAGFTVHYFSIEDEVSLEEALTRTAGQINAQRVFQFESEDRALNRNLAAAAERLGVSVIEKPSPMFLLDREAIDEYFQRHSRPRMANFYRAQRQRMGLLLEDGKPVGGRWSFDSENRARLPRDQTVPELPVIQHSSATRRCLRRVTERFADHPGNAESLWLPCDQAGASAWLDEFLEQRFIGFGTYEDAITERSPTLFHSALSPLMNIGLITPEEVVRRTLAAAEEFRVPLNDLEGFLRQIVGWREFVRGVYREHRQTLRESNVWGGHRMLADSWLSGETGLLPLDHATRTAIDYGWNHHIERLMVLANLMNLAEIEPGAAYHFFMTHYIDAYDWVMVPNLFGMGLNADGGIFTTKPYICGSNYIRKMSDHPGGEWTEVMDGLYWRFVARHREVLEENPRMAMLTRGLDRMSATRRKQIFSQAETFIEKHTRTKAA